MKIVLLAKSSSGESYKVEFLGEESCIRVFCHCQAGVLQHMCKHKLALLKGDESMLSDPKQAFLLSEIHTWPQFGTVKTHVDEFEKKLKEIEVAKEVLGKKEKTIKAEFARGLAKGFK
jgi:hypothetical protein